MSEEKQFKVVEKLINKDLHISFAESCTGGLVSGALVDVPDASNVFDGSFVTYANEAKIKYLKVKSTTIEKFGVVSEEVAGEMAIGCANANKCEIGVGISGIAGPSGGTEEKPIGTVCFGFFINGKTFTCKINFGDIGRNAVRKKSVDFVYNTLDSLL